MPLDTSTEEQSSAPDGDTSQPGVDGGGAPAGTARIRVGRHGEMAADELARLLDSIDTERERARFRESLYISIFCWLVVAWFVFYGPRVLWHAPKLINPADVLKQRELTQLTAPVLPDAPALKPKAAPPPRIDEKTMEKLKELAKRQPAPAATPVPAPEAAQPVLPAPAPAAPTPPPVVQPKAPLPQPVADAPTVQPTKPNFGGQTSAGNSIRSAIEGAAKDRSGGGFNAGGRRSSPLNLGGAEILSDTQGVDFGPYLRRVIADVYRNWQPLIPPEAQPPLLKQGETWIRFTILPDGTIGAMHLDGSTHDQAIDRSCWGSITSEGQFPPLPSQFHGPNLELRFHYMVNKEPQ